MSEERTYKDHEQPGAGLRECPVCGKLFWSRWAFEKFCSPECRAEIQRQRVRARNKKYREQRKAQPKSKSAPAKKSDAIEWDEIRAVLAEFGTSSYHKAIEIIEQRRKEAKEKELAEAMEKGENT